MPQASPACFSLLPPALQPKFPLPESVSLIMLLFPPAVLQLFSGFPAQQPDEFPYLLLLFLPVHVLLLPVHIYSGIWLFFLHNLPASSESFHAPVTQAPEVLHKYLHDFSSGYPWQEELLPLMIHISSCRDKNPHIPQNESDSESSLPVPSDAQFYYQTPPQES